LVCFVFIACLHIVENFPVSYFMLALMANVYCFTTDEEVKQNF